jgi:hypothetical protein
MVLQKKNFLSLDYKMISFYQSSFFDLAVCHLGEQTAYLLFTPCTLNFCRCLTILADTIMTLDYPELNLILNCAGTSSAAAEDSAISKKKKEERRHSAPLPVATAATAQAARSTANAVISSVLQRAIVPQQDAGIP